MYSVEEITHKVLSIKLFLTDSQRSMLTILFRDNLALGEKFLATCGNLGIKEVTDDEFFSLTGMRDVSDKMLEALVGDDPHNYFCAFCEISLPLFFSKLEKRLFLFNRYSLIKGKKEPCIETKNSLEYFKGMDVAFVERLYLYLAKNVSRSREEYYTSYYILRER